MAGEISATKNLLATVAGTSITLKMDIQGAEQPARIAVEDLTRVLVNLVKNAVEAMSSVAGGCIRIALHERQGKDGQWLVLAVEDNGPGIPEEALEQVFESGYTTRAQQGRWSATHRGLGLAISRAVVEAAGGTIHAELCALGGARLVIELPAAL
jgi:two-component system sensor histidine kinase ChvG